MLTVVPTNPNKAANGTATIPTSNPRRRVITGHLFKDANIRAVGDIAIRHSVAVEIAGLIKRKKIKPESVAARFEVSESNAARLVRGEFGRYTLEQLLRFLNLLDQDVVITFMKASPKQEPHISVQRI